MKSVKRIAVTALVLCAVSAMGVSAQADPYYRSDAGRRHVESRYDGGRYERDYGRTREWDRGYNGHHRHGYVNRRTVVHKKYVHKSGPGFSATLKLTPNLKIKIKG